FVITRKMKVNAVDHFNAIPAHWPVPDVDTAYVLDMMKNKVKSLDAYLKLEDQDSYGLGTNGSTVQDTKLQILSNLPTHCSSHKCNGALQCEQFDDGLLSGYEHMGGNDFMKTQELFKREKAQNMADGDMVLGITDTFFRLIVSMKCKKSCNGHAVLKPLSKPPLNEGKAYFVGCSKWEKSERWQQIYAPIPSTVNESILFQLMNGECIKSPDLARYEMGCATILHPCHGQQQYCKHVHGHSVQCQLVCHDCPVQKIVYTLKDCKKPYVVVIFKSRHLHPPWPEEKPTQEAKDDLKQCLDALGISGATADRLDNASTTLAILGSSLSLKHKSFQNQELLKVKIWEQKDLRVPAGYHWQGIIDQYEKDQKMPVAEHYIWHLQMEGDVKLVVTLNSVLAALLHTALYIVMSGELDECEFVIWHAPTNKHKCCITIAHVYCNSATHKAFDYLFEALFTSIEKATGHKVRFHVFEPTTGNLLAIILDMEAAQVQGLGDALVKLQMNKSQQSRIYNTDPEVIVQYILKLCTVHFERCSDELVEAVGHNGVDYLNKFRALMSTSDIAAWHAFCKDHPSEKLKSQFSSINTLMCLSMTPSDWYAHKISYPWLLPGFNKSLMNSAQTLGLDITSHKSHRNCPCRNQPAHTDRSSAIGSY
ncbi:hypothetical protein L208DRAFT_1288337, partial [Tricholoma matsutake]